MASPLFVFIYLPGQTTAVPAGLFSRDAANGVGDFAYGRRYLARDDALPVDPISCPLHGPIAPTALHGGLYGAFRDAAPDYWGRLIVAKERREDPARLDDMDLLLRGGSSRVGNLDFRASRDDPEPDTAIPAFTDLRDLVAAADAVQHGLPVDDAWLDILRQGTSVGGARPKCVIEHDGHLWLAKFPAREDAYNNARVEHATLQMARAAGIDTAHSEVRPLSDGRDLLLLKRFDREPVAGGYARTGFVSALTVLQLDDQDRFGWSYVTLAERLRQHRIPADTHAQLYRRMVFNIACRNMDDHPRNHGFLLRDTGLALSPAYDIVPSTARPGVATDFSLAMTVGELGREGTVENALSRCESFGLTRTEAVEICEGVGEVASQWRGWFDRAGVGQIDQALFAASFAQGEALARTRQIAGRL